MSTSGLRAFLAVILLLYCLFGAIFAIYTPPWQAPDEPAHYNYVRYVAEKGQFPVLHMGDYPHAYLEQIKAAGFPTNMSIDPIRYEFHQPPLYYALLAPIYTLAQGDLLVLRLVSVALGAGIVLLTYAIGRRVFPQQPGLALGAAAFVAFLPQHLATVSQVGNDVLAELLLAAVLYGLVGEVKGTDGIEGTKGTKGTQGNEGILEGAGAGTRSLFRNLRFMLPTRLSSLVRMGALLGLILITKTTAYIAVPLAAGVLIWWWRRERAGLRRMMGEAAAVILPAAVIALPWYARNISVYGWPDFLGLQRHDAIVIGQARLADFVAQHGWGAYWQRAAEWTFKSFVGVFGWMGVWLDTRVYFALAVLGGTAAGGWLLRAAYRALHTPYLTDATKEPSRNRQYAVRHTQYAIRNTQYAVHLLALSALLTFLTYAWYNTQFLQHQGRYLFTALIPIALAFAAGWDGIVRPGAGRWLAAGLVALAGGLAIWGVTLGPGLPKWPIAIAVTAAVGVFMLDPTLTLLARARGYPAAGRAFDLLRAAATAFPYTFLALTALYALFGVIVPQLTQVP